MILLAPADVKITTTCLRLSTYSSRGRHQKQQDAVKLKLKPIILHFQQQYHLIEFFEDRNSCKMGKKMCLRSILLYQMRNGHKLSKKGPTLVMCSRHSVQLPVSGHLQNKLCPWVCTPNSSI